MITDASDVVKRREQLTVPEYTYANADMVSDFGGAAPDAGMTWWWRYEDPPALTVGSAPADGDVVSRDSPVGYACRIEVDVHIGTAEGVDCLLGVTDDQQPLV